MTGTRFTAGILTLFTILAADPARCQERAVRPVEIGLVSVVDSMLSTLPEMEARHERVVAAADSMAALYRALSLQVANAAETAAGQEAETLVRALHELQETNMSFNLRYLQLQQRMQEENRRFTLLSNIMKTKHDTAKNSIRNIR